MPRSIPPPTPERTEDLWERILTEVRHREAVERAWTEILLSLYPTLQIPDLSARFLRPWRLLQAEGVSLADLPERLAVAALDLPGWLSLPVVLCQAFGDTQPGLDRLTVELSGRLVASAAASDPGRRARPRDPGPARSRARGDSVLPQCWTATAGLVGSSHAMREIVAACGEAARDRYPTLVLGETGAGKEVVARLIHHLSAARGPFIAVNCAALPEALMEAELFGHERGAFTGAANRRDGLFQQSHGGTLLLDEISETPLHQQAKILRVLQDGLVRRVGGSQHEPIDVRVVATSNRDLEEALSRGSLRRDLYYRLAVHEIRAPPLRRHPEDIPELVAAFLARWQRSNRALGLPVFAADALDALARYRWPGNVRQLEHTVYRLSSQHPGRSVTRRAVERVLGVDPSPGEGGSRPRSAGTRLKDVEHDAILEALALCAGNKSAAARMLGISRKTLYHKLDVYGPDGES